MADVAFAVPIVEGKETLDRHVMQEMDNTRREQYEAAMQRAGMKRHAVWHQETPQGMVAVVYVEADDPVAALREFGASDEPFNQWFRERMQEVHGIDISASVPEVREVHDHVL